MNTLVGQNPAVILPHGPTKRLVDEYLWHEPNVGIVAAYTPNERDVEDHFGIFRAVDQVESFGQAAVVSCSVFLDTQKMGISYEEYYKNRNFVFVGVKHVHCHNVIRYKEKYICLGIINSYKFRQMTASGRLYKVPPDIDLEQYFQKFTEKQLQNYELDERFIYVTELHDMLGKGVKNDKLHPAPVTKISLINP